MLITEQVYQVTDNGTELQKIFDGHTYIRTV